MIVVTVEVWPRGERRRARNVATMYVANDGTSELESRGNYKAAVMRRGAEVPPSGWTLGPSSDPLRTGEVRDFPRHSYHVLRLISRCILACFPEERR